MQTTFWGSLTRAVRTPSRAELHGKIVDPNIPGGEIVIGSPDQESDNVLAAELGYPA